MTQSLFDPADRRRASRLLRRHGVRRADRNTLLDDVLAELDSAAADGKDASSVLGVNRDTELLAWASELGITGRTAQLPKVMGSFLIATSVAIALALIGTFADLQPAPLIVALYLVSAIVCVAGSGGLTAWWLRRCSDHRVRATLYWTVLVLPVGGIAAAAAGWLVARQLSYELDDSTTTAVLAAVLLVLAAAVVTARLIALRGAGSHTTAAANLDAAAR